MYYKISNFGSWIVNKMGCLIRYAAPAIKEHAYDSNSR